MIPKIIHYCWISGEENMPEDIKQCISSWHKHLPDYQFINWNDANFDWNICEFTKYNRGQNNYAFCSDYIRFWALYNFGGIYFDSDVKVYKSFDELLKLKRIITPESVYPYSRHYEAAIIGAEKGDILFKHCVEWYNNCTDKFDTKGYHVISPFVMDICWKDRYKTIDIPIYNDEVQDDDVISILDCTKYFSEASNECFAQHTFKGEWCLKTTPNCYDIDKYQIFLCAHKPIENYIPNNKHYTIIDVNGTVKDDSRNIIDISQDEFTKTHNVCYSEGCAMRWLWKHPEVIPDYIVFGHYRRMFLDFANGNEIFITRWIDNKGAIIQTPFIHTSNISDMYKDHPKDDIDIFIQIVKELTPEYYNAFQEYLSDTNQYACNCFAMKKEHFLEMCEFCFKVLDEFDKRQGYKNNDSVMRKMIKNSHTNHLRFGINWQRRLQGFLLEYLTDTFYRYKFGVENCRKCDCGIPDKPNNPFEK